MPRIWDGCVKIHEGCGGVCRWVEAIDRPAVGWTGECVACGDTDIPTECMIPLESYDHAELLRVSPCDTLENLEWDEGAMWHDNQARLSTVVDELIRKTQGGITNAQ